MKVFSTIWHTSRAVKRGYRDGSEAKYRAFPVGTNKIEMERAFETEEELAKFLLTNPEWKTYFRSDDGTNGQHHATII